ncbi:specifically androgen-regulated gene protein [Amphiprion ocellaris]|uniref:Specifically androgen-regulated gene protein n=1 Tax=Amphiprion ocellaris TaxID=80972 RepID=A0AAQ5Y4Y0_AMPOC|nr:specifically androgen-regulated gene protein [Amphiprion ocellaris]
MPKSDTWPGGIGLETLNGMDSAGSCDSVVSANSAFSDDSLEYLSAEEKACLMFLEETIESLDTEEDSGLSNDEPEQLSSHGALAAKLADLSASMSKSKLNGSQSHDSKELIKENVDIKPVQSYLVPTPFVLASSSVPTTKTLYSKPQFTFQNNKPNHKHNQKPVAPPVPLEVNVVIPPSTKPREYLGRTAEGPLPRGPLSYEALVHLRRSASAKKTPLCPRIDHTIDLEKHIPAPVDGPKFGNPPRADRYHLEVSSSKIAPPLVAPKPKKITANITVKTQSEGSKTSSTSYGVKHATDPQVVRQEALQKLGLLKDQEPENDTVAPLPPPKSLTSLNPTPNRFTRAPSNCNPSRSPSFCYSKEPTEPKSRPLQSSASFHHYSRHDEQPVSVSHPDQSNGLKTAGLRYKQRKYPEPQHMSSTKPVKTTTTAQPVPQQPSNSVEYTVMVVPGMGADRKEALRKLGLLRD